jgi:hypothetical protein
MYIRDDQGRTVNPESVTYVIQRPDGTLASGRNVPALKNSDDSYYISWITPNVNGPYIIRWSYRYQNRISTIDQNVYVLDPSAFTKNGEILGIQQPASESKTFMSGSELGSADLAIYFTDEFKNKVDPFAVFATIFDNSGKTLLSRREASRAGFGHYWIYWKANSITSSDNRVLFEWSQTSTDPLQSSTLFFNVINPSSPSLKPTCDCNCRCDCDMPICGCLCTCQSVLVTFPDSATWCQNA